MPSRFTFAAAWCALAALVSMSLLPAAAQQVSREISLLAREQLFVEITAGAAQMRSRTVGTGEQAKTDYYVLIPRLRSGAAVLVFDAAETRVAQVPAPEAAVSASAAVAELDQVVPKPVTEQYGLDFDVDAEGRVYIADRAAGAIRIYSPQGELLRSLTTLAPTSIAALPEGELAVTGARSESLVTVLNSSGKPMRSFGDRLEVADTDSGDLNRFLNLGKLASDPAGNLYYAFSYVPEPTVRKYDRWGYLLYTAELATLDFQPAARAARRNIERLKGGRINFNEVAPAQIKPTITAIATDPVTQQLWVAMGGLLLHFNREGDRIGTYRTYTKQGVRVEASAIVVEPDRLLLASDALGVFAFDRPDKPAK